MSQNGVLVRSVELQSTISSGRQTKDLIIGMDDDEIRSYDDLQDALLKRKAGDKVTLKIIRDNQEKELSVVLAERP